MVTEVVYFVCPKDKGAIKIGRSRDLGARLHSLMAWSPYPLHIYATCTGGADLEKAIQRFFAHNHSHGEWFRPAEDLLKFMDFVAAGGNPRDIIDLSEKRPCIHFQKLMRDDPLCKEYQSLRARFGHVKRRASHATKAEKKAVETCGRYLDEWRNAPDFTDHKPNEPVLEFIGSVIDHMNDKYLSR